MEWAQIHRKWTAQDYENFSWSDESQILLRHADGRVRIWCKQHESMDSLVVRGGGLPNIICLDMDRMGHGMTEKLVHICLYAVYKVNTDKLTRAQCYMFNSM